MRAAAEKQDIDEASATRMETSAPASAVIVDQARSSAQQQREALIGGSARMGALQRKQAQSNTPMAKVLQRVELTPQNYDEVKTYMAGILKEYPVSEYYYLSLGRSPTPLIAFLHAAGQEGNLGNIGSNLPLSKFSHKTAASTGVGLAEKLSSAQLAELHTHFDRFVPTSEQLGGRKLLLIDFVATGRSLIGAADHLRQYITQKYETDLFKLWTGFHGYGLAGTIAGDDPPEVQALALTERTSAPSAKQFLDPQNIPSKVIPGSMQEEASLGHMMGAEHFKNAAEYPKEFIIKDGHRSADLKRSAEYDDLVQQFKIFMRKDDGMAALNLFGPQRIEMR